MQKKIIRFCYRKIIDNASQKAWEKLVFESSYTEFLIQSQLYNREKKYASFADLIINVEGSKRLHFLVSAAVNPYVELLQGKFPDILNTLGQHFLLFQNYRFEIINSDIKNIKAHQIAINFISEPMLWHATIGDMMLLSSENAEQTTHGAAIQTMRLQPFVSVYSLNQQ